MLNCSKSLHRIDQHNNCLYSDLSRKGRWYGAASIRKRSGREKFKFGLFLPRAARSMELPSIWPLLPPSALAYFDRMPMSAWVEMNTTTLSQVGFWIIMDKYCYFDLFTAVVCQHNTTILRELIHTWDFKAIVKWFFKSHNHFYIMHGIYRACIQCPSLLWDSCYVFRLLAKFVSFSECYKMFHFFSFLVLKCIICTLCTIK